MAEIGNVIQMLDELSQDRTVPRNVRTAVIKAKEDLSNEKLDLGFRVSSAISILDEVANDINLPSYSRTNVWNVVSALETLNEVVKKK
jgi:uncharacterized protein (UPF0147 family)